MLNRVPNTFQFLSYPITLGISTLLFCNLTFAQTNVAASACVSALGPEACGQAAEIIEENTGRAEQYGQSYDVLDGLALPSSAQSASGSNNAASALGNTNRQISISDLAPHTLMLLQSMQQFGVANAAFGSGNLSNIFSNLGGTGSTSISGNNVFNQAQTYSDYYEWMLAIGNAISALGLSQYSQLSGFGNFQSGGGIGNIFGGGGSNFGFGNSQNGGGNSLWNVFGGNNGNGSNNWMSTALVIAGMVTGNNGLISAGNILNMMNGGGNSMGGNGLNSLLGGTGMGTGTGTGTGYTNTNNGTFNPVSNLGRSAAIARTAETIQFSTANAPGTDGGNLACMWALNHVVNTATGKPIDGTSTSYGLSTVSTLAALRSDTQRFTRVDINSVIAGDVCVAATQYNSDGSASSRGHGYVVGEKDQNGQNLAYHNSSSQAAWRQYGTIQGYASNRHGSGLECYRVNS